MRIAIVGAGIAGLATLWHLLQDPSVSATLFDANEIGSGASGASTGLLHPFPSRDARRSWRAEEGMRAAMELIEVAETALKAPVAERTGLLRLALSDTQKRDLKARAQVDSEAVWIEEGPSIVPGAAPFAGIWVAKGVTVYSQLYLQGLWQAAKEKGATKETREIRSLQDLDGFDAVVLAVGAATFRFPECRHLLLKTTKGQKLLCRWSKRLPCSLLAQGHLTPTPDPSVCQIGATYERQFSSFDPEPEKAMELLEKVALFYPPARDFEVLGVQAGVRISPVTGYRPIVEKIAPKAWVFTGLGSRGLLYHALLGKELAREIMAV